MIFFLYSLKRSSSSSPSLIPLINKDNKAGISPSANPDFNARPLAMRISVLSIFPSAKTILTMLYSCSNRLANS